MHQEGRTPRNRLRIGLRARLFLIALVAAVPASGVAVARSLERRAHAQQTVADQVLGLARIAGQSHDDLIVAAQQLLPTLAAMPEVLGPDRSDCSRRMGLILGQYPLYLNLGAIDATGTLFCSALPFDGRPDFSGEPYFSEALTHRTFSMGQYRVSRLTDRGALYFALPAVQSGEVRAVVFAALDLDRLADAVAQAELPSGSVVTVFDREGTILARSPGGEAWMGSSLPEAPVVAEAQSMREGSLQAVGVDGVDRIYGIVQLRPTQVAAAVHVAVGVPVEEVYRDIAPLETVYLGVPIAAGVLALLGAWIVGEASIRRRVLALAGAARAFGEGRRDLDAGAARGGDEIGDLALAFEEMAGDVTRHENAVARAAAELVTANRALRLLSESNQTIIRADDEVEMIQRVCEVMAEVGGFRLVWVGLTDGPEPGIRVAGSAGPAAGYLETLLPMSPSDPGDPRPMPRALRSGRTTVVQDIRKDRGFEPWQGSAAEAGIAAILALPLTGSQGPLGALGLYSPEPDAFSPGEVDLLEELAGDLSYGILSLRSEGARRRAEESLGDLSTFHQTLVATMSEALVVEDQNGIITFINRSGAEILGRPAEAVVGRPWREVIPPDQHGRVEAANARRRSGRSDRYDLELERPDGSRAVVLVSGTPLRRDGPYAGTLAVFTDISEVRRAQEGQALRDRLATVGQLAAGIAHDFNNIIGAILLYSELVLAEPGLSAEARQRTQTVVHQAQRAAELTQQILDFGRRSIIERRSVDLGQLLAAFVRLIQRTLPETIEVRADHGEDTYLVEADPGRLQQVMMNLALNARDAMSGGGNLVFGLSRLEVAPGQPPFRDMPSGPWVRLEVRDDGGGIEPQVLRHVFEPFFTTKEAGKGVGLGLSQVYGIVKQHDGYIDVSSTVGEGTTFVIYLPAATASPEADRPPEPEAVGRGEAVLVVEDDAATRQALCDTLVSLSYQPVEAEDGIRALEIYRASATPYAAVISDVVMPRMGGIELYRALRAIDPEVRMLLISGYPLGKDTGELFDPARVGWLPKPFDMHALGRSLRRVLPARPGAPPE